MNDAEKVLLNESLKKDRLCFKALGRSMFPLIRNGDLVTIKAVNPEKLEIGDIIFYKKDDKYLLHRLIKINHEDLLYCTKGDNLPSADLPINHEAILGILVSLKRNDHEINLNSNFYKRLGKLLSLIHPLTYPITGSILKGYNLIVKLSLFF